MTYATATGEGPAGPEHRQAALAALGRQALRNLDPGALMAQATALIAETLETELTGVFEFSEDGASLILRAGAGWDEGSIDRLRLAAVGQAGSYSDLIREHLKERGESALDAYLDAVRRAGQRLTHTIDQILDYSNIEAGTLELRPVEIALGPLLDSLGREFAALAAGKGLDFRVALEASDVVVRFDERCLRNGLTSLLENAVKFTERGEIAVRLYRGGADSFELEIRDTGVGIGSGYMTRLAEPFSQEESGEIRQFEGAGLGLALTYRYLKLNGADLTVKSVKGEGTTVTVRFASSV